jgi:hypothetical protein
MPSVKERPPRPAEGEREQPDESWHDQALRCVSEVEQESERGAEGHGGEHDGHLPAGHGVTLAGLTDTGGGSVTITGPGFHGLSMAERVAALVERRQRPDDALGLPLADGGPRGAVLPVHR